MCMVVQLVMNELVITLHQRMQDNIKSMEVATFGQEQIYTLMEQIAHSSIIKLNQQSMNNLYYLITMSLKMYIQQTKYTHTTILVHQQRYII